MDGLRDFIEGPDWAWSLVHALGWFVVCVYVAWAAFYLYQRVQARREEAEAYARQRRMLAARERMLPEVDVPESSAHIIVPYLPASTGKEVTAPLLTVPLPRRTVVVDGQRVPLED